MTIIFSGIVGAIIGATITGSINYYIFMKSKKPPSGAAYEVLKKIGKRLKEPEGEYHLSKSALDNANIAKDIYSHSDGKVICTAFNENPVQYGLSDFVQFFKCGPWLRRITSEEICDNVSQGMLKSNMKKVCEGSMLIVMPKGEPYTRIDGIFCRYKDETNLAFVAFRDPTHAENNMGVVFRNGIAEYFYDYYDRLANKYDRT